MTFATPSWLWALALLLPAVLLRVWGRMEGRDAVGLLVSPRLRDDLLFGASRRRGARWWRFALLSAAFACLVTALARPQWGEITQEIHGEGRNVMIAIDTSRSMLATDLKPDRLTRAKFAALDLIEALPQDQIGLMAFSGTAFVQVPLTTDREALSEAIEQLDTYSISRGGTNLSSAIKLASNSFKDTGANQHALLLFTDGEELEGEALKEAKKAAKEGTTIIAIGVGSTDGSIIPDPESRVPGGAFIKDDDGEVVRTRLDTTALEKIARASDGLFIHLDANAMNAELVRNALSKLDTTETEGGTKTIPIERYQWPMGAGLLLLAIAVLSRLWQRRPSASRAPAASAGLASVLLLSVCANSDAGIASEASQLYADGEFKKAAERYVDAIDRYPTGERNEKLQLGLGAAQLNAGDHPRALEAFGQALLSDDSAVQQQAHYNLGNTLFRAGETHLKPPDADKPDAAPAPPAPPSEAAVEQTLRDWRGAIDHYESTLALNPDHADAAFNLDVVRNRIKELEQQQQEQQQQQEENSDPENSDQKDDPQENKDENPADDPQNSENSSPENGNDEQTPEPEENGEEKSPGDQEQGTEGGNGDGQQVAEMEAGEEGDQQVNEETGYTVEQARRQLEALANEQEVIQKKRRRARARLFKDW